MTATGTGEERHTVVVVGGGRGIGAAISELFAARRWDVWVGDTDRLQNATNQYRSPDVGGYEAAASLAARLRHEGRVAHAISVDACDEQSVAAMFNAVRSRSPQIDAVINAFGVTWVSPFESMTLDAFENVLKGNLTGVFLCCRAALTHVTESRGAIVNIASVAGRSGFPKVSAYSAAKFAIVGLSNALAKEVALSGVRVNTLCPGIVMTNMWEYLLDEFTRDRESRDECWARMEAMVPSGEAQAAADVAEAAWFLATNRAMTGRVLTIDGGMIPVP